MDVFLYPNLLARVGSVLSVVGAAYIFVRICLRPARTVPDLGETESIRFYRAELEPQRNFHRGAWLWSRVVLFVTGPMIFLLGFAQGYPTFPTFPTSDKLVLQRGAAATST
jgi:hypothetical protein